MKVRPKKILLTLGAVLIIGALGVMIWGFVSQTTATAPLQQAAHDELAPLVPAVSALMQGSAPTNRLECTELSHTHIKVNLYCQYTYWYGHEVTPPVSSRPHVLAEAATLDRTLAQNGWTADRPQDKNHTVASTVPTSPLAKFEVAQVPFHKNAKGMSCNLVVDFMGPTDGKAPGTIGISRFSCQENISYFMLSPTLYVNQGFGG